MGLSATITGATTLVLATTLLGAGPAPADAPDARAAASKRFVMVSVDAKGRPADNDATGASVSRDGRWVAFGSGATNLDRRTRAGQRQVYLRDNRTGRVRAVGADRRGRLADVAESVSLSPNGRFVAFCSTDELVGPDSTDVDDNTPNSDVFVRDLRKGTVRRASSTPGGGEADDYSCSPDVADNGDVGFFSRATDLVAGDTNGVPDYFLYDWGSRKVRRLATAEIASGSVRISGDGSAAAVVTTEVLAGRDSGALPDVYVLSRSQGVRGTWSMPLTQDEGLPTDTGCGWTGLSISGTGRYVTGACSDGGIAATPIADKPVHLWWTDRRSGDVRLVNRTPDNDSEVDVAQVSDDGRRVFFGSRERAYARAGAGRFANYQGVFVWQRGDGVRSLTPGDAWWDDYGFDASGDGRTVAFASGSEAMGVPPPVLGDGDLQIFTRRIGR
ncbi:hypothetical protein L2K70_14840 [Nocardioides KLBMP 9356]|uniref:WD40 repeat protein n=1 Tax=Nocardioides potassii TaxID=2911371 RepID=A0ABS9HF87_9ACTN|nr:hypothetical protein [Nocardioides potassii]MCF6378890.1 hypothetical protein [Nocardioides potassii]